MSVNSSFHWQNVYLLSTRLDETSHCINLDHSFQMSWLFGYKKPTIELPTDGGAAPPPSGAGGNEKPEPKVLGGHQSVYKFDSTALERAAQAAKELERSRTFRLNVDF